MWSFRKDDFNGAIGSEREVFLSTKNICPQVYSRTSVTTLLFERLTFPDPVKLCTTHVGFLPPMMSASITSVTSSALVGSFGGGGDFGGCGGGRDFLLECAFEKFER